MVDEPVAHVWVKYHSPEDPELETVVWCRHCGLHQVEVGTMPCLQADFTKLEDAVHQILINDRKTAQDVINDARTILNITKAACAKVICGCCLDQEGWTTAERDQALGIIHRSKFDPTIRIQCMASKIWENIL